MGESLIQQCYVSEDGYFGCKALSMRRIMTLLIKEVPANSVPAAAVIRGGRVLFGMTGRKESVGGLLSEAQKFRAQP